MSGLASIQAQLGKHRNAYLAAAAGAVVLLALRNRKKTAAAGAGVPAAITSGNPQFSAGAAQLDTSSLTSQLWDIQSSLNGLTAGSVPNPATQAGGGLAGGLPISAPLGGGSVLTDQPTTTTATGVPYVPPTVPSVTVGQIGHDYALAPDATQEQRAAALDAWLKSVNP